MKRIDRNVQTRQKCAIKIEMYKKDRNLQKKFKL